MPKLVVDIETIGQSYEDMDALTQKEVARYIKSGPGSPEYDAELEEVKRNLVFSPTTGEIVAIGVLDFEKNKGVVYFQAPDKKIDEFTEDNFTYKPMDETAMLNSFWGGADKYDTFITFNGRGFDIPYINARSAVRGVHVLADLMSNRYLNQNWRGPLHVDLMDQLNYYGAFRRSGSLHMWCRAFGIPSPKEGEVNAGDVGKSFKEGKYEEIARYNARDLVATAALYKHWNEYIRV